MSNDRLNRLAPRELDRHGEACALWLGAPTKRATRRSPCSYAHRPGMDAGPDAQARGTGTPGLTHSAWLRATIAFL